MDKYDHKKIEKKWQKIWERERLHEAKNFSKKPKYYCLIEFPYPSGEGLHVGHIRSNTAMDILARKKRSEGHNVLYPIGWDAFGLPTENYAIKTGIHPKIVTKRNTDNFRRQLKSIGFSFDWSREINTTDPKYYKWTQWMFLQFYKKGLAYKKKISINWCVSCKIGLANEEAAKGECERCGGHIEKRDKEQWMLAITKYADRLIEDLDVVDYPEEVKTQQRNWIGKSEGAEVSFKIKANSLQLGEVKIFTTRIDTIFGCTYILLAPEHGIISNLKSLSADEAGKISNIEEVEKYIAEAKNKTELQRTDLAKEKTGVELKGIKAINPFNNEEVPVFVADYVLGGYGTGAVMAVPAHDERDLEFAKKYNLKRKIVIKPFSISGEAVFNAGLDHAIKKRDDKIKKIELMEEAYTDTTGVLIDSGKYTGMTTSEAPKEMIKELEERKLGGKKVNYKLKDWVFSRQRYWGEPIPLIHCDNCKTKKALLIHGFEGNGNKHWFLWLKKKLEERGIKVYNPTISTANHPSVDSWLKELAPIINDFGPNDIIVGHSLGSNAALQLIQKINKNIGNFFLLASAIGRPRSKEFWLEIENSSPKSDIVSLRKFWESKIDYKKVARLATSVMIIRSSDDDLIPKDTHENLPSEFAQEEWQGYGHFTGQLEIPKLWEKIEKIISDGVVPVPEKDLPVKLPEVKNYQPTDTGESPLAKIEKWVNVKCPKCEGKAKRETDTMPNWAGSSWYFLRYLDSKNNKTFADKKKMSYWMPVDWYNGGMEHVTLHLLYSRFWNKFLYDIESVPISEPYKKRTAHGLVLAESGGKMSKSKGNVINPDDIVTRFGADTLRVYEMFMGPFDQPISWSTDNMLGSRRFLERVFNLKSKISNLKYKADLKLEILLNNTIKKVTEDIENFRFNTAISALMILLNEMEKTNPLEVEYYKIVIKLLSPFAPHICDELWSQLGAKKSIHLEKWPKYDESKLESVEVIIVVQVNGKVRGSFKVEKDKNKQEIENIALSLPEIKKHIGDSKVQKIFFVKNKIVSIVI